MLVRLVIASRLYTSLTHRFHHTAFIRRISAERGAHAISYSRNPSSHPTNAPCHKKSSISLLIRQCPPTGVTTPPPPPLPPRQPNRVIPTRTRRCNHSAIDSQSRVSGAPPLVVVVVVCNNCTRIRWIAATALDAANRTSPRRLWSPLRDRFRVTMITEKRRWRMTTTARPQCCLHDHHQRRHHIDSPRTPPTRMPRPVCCTRPVRTMPST